MVDIKPNNGRDEIKLQGKLDFRLGQDINLTLEVLTPTNMKCLLLGEEYY